MGDDDIPPDAPIGDAIKPLDTVIVTRDYASSSTNVLTISAGEVIHVLSKSATGWWDGVMVDQRSGETVRGWFPSTYCKPATVETSTKISANGETTTVVSVSASRKNSTVSFASSERSFESAPGTASPKPQIYNHQSLSSSVLSRPSQTSQLKNSITSTVSSASADSTPRAINPADVELFFNNDITPSFVPSWIPYLTDSEKLVYYNQKLNVVTSAPPFIEQPFIDETTEIDLPDANIVAQMDAVSISDISQRGDEDDIHGERLNYGSFPLQRVSMGGSEGSSGSYRGRESIDGRNFMLCEPDAFYYDPTDIKNWNQMKAVLVMMVDFTVDALKKESKELFLSHLSTVSRLVTLLQLSARLLHTELVGNSNEASVQKAIKKIMATLLQLTVNGTLHLSADENSPNFMGNLQSDSNPDSEDAAHSRDNEATPQNPGMYLDRATDDAHQLQTRACALCDVFLSLELSSGKPAFYMPQVYPRFFKNRDEFSGGFFSNPIFINDDVAHRNSAMGPKVLLDEDALKTLDNKRLDLEKLLDDVLAVITTEMPMDTPVTVFEQDRNMNATTLLYHCMPAMNRVMQILESLDFTFFVMLKSLLRKSRDKAPSAGRGGSVPRKDYNYEDDGPMTEELDSSVSEASTANTEESQPSAGSNVYFYEASLKMVQPTIQEFVEAKQQLYDIFTELILSAQALTLDDPEAFTALFEDPAIEYNKSLRETEVERLAKRLENLLVKHDLEIQEQGKSSFDTLTSLEDSISKARLRMAAVIEVASILREQRSKIITYLSRLMDSDFDVAALFVAERHNTMYSSVTSHPDSMSSYLNDDYFDRSRHARSSESEVPWFLDIDDDERDLIYDANGLRGGSKRGLVSRLVNPDHYVSYRGSFSSVDKIKLSSSVDDVTFVHTFLLMFRTMFTPEEFFRAIIDKYNPIMPEGLSFEEYELWTAKKLVPTQSWIQELFETLLTQYWNVHYTSPALVETWKSYVGENAVEDRLNLTALKVFSIEQQDEYYAVFGGGTMSRVSREELGRPPAPLLFNRMIIKRNSLSLREIEALELARQLSLIQYDLYVKITQGELLARAWSKKYGEIGSSPNITNFVKNCNMITHFTSYSVLRKVDTRKRAEVIKYLILVAEKCLKLRNFSTMTAIISGLGSTQISRLKKTWALVPKHIVKNFERLDSVMSFGRNYSEYRSMLKFMENDQEPCLPFLGMYLSDLRFMSDGNKDWLQSNKKYVNFSKRQGLASIITDALKHGRVPYNFERVDEIQNFIQSYFDSVPDEETMYQLSLKLEPRVTTVGKSM